MRSPPANAPGHAAGMATVMWGAEMAAVYDQTAAEMYEPAYESYV